jgi:transcriptional regulator with XRE-family HTH domain
MSPRREEHDPVRQETERLMEMLRIFVRTLGFGNTEIARRSKIPHANVGRYFRGEARVPLDFIIAVVHALGLEFSEFFELAYAEQPSEPTEARRKIERILSILPVRRVVRAEPAGTAPPEPVPQPQPQRPDIEKLLEDLRKEVNAMLDARQAEAVTPPPEPERKMAQPKVRKSRSGKS